MRGQPFIMAACVILKKAEVRFTETTLIVKNDQLLASQIGQEAVMMCAETGKYYGLNETGTCIWNLLAAPTTYGDLCRKLASSFGISEEQCTVDITPFIYKMVEERIITVK